MSDAKHAEPEPVYEYRVVCNDGKSQCVTPVDCTALRAAELCGRANLSSDHSHTIVRAKRECHSCAEKDATIADLLETLRVERAQGRAEFRRGWDAAQKHPGPRTPEWEA